MAILLTITDWNQHFENNRTRDLKVMSWLPVPVKLGGDGYTEILDHPNGTAHFGAWIAILQVAAGCDDRGTLLRGNRSGVRSPHDAQSLARMTRIPVGIIEEALPRLIASGWVTAVELRGDGMDAAASCGIPAPSCADPAEPCGVTAPRASPAVLQDSTEEERTVQRTTPPTHPRSADAPVPAREEQAPSQPEEPTGAEPPDALGVGWEKRRPEPYPTAGNGKARDPADEKAFTDFGQAILAAWPPGHVNPASFEQELFQVWQQGLIRADGTEPRTEKSRTASQVLGDLPRWKLYWDAGGRPQNLENYLKMRRFQVAVPDPPRDGKPPPASKPKEWNPGVTAQRLERARAKMFRRPERQIEIPENGGST